jgi:nucleoside-diphosphate-sugar epimerase
MRVFVTGATGFIGSAIVRELIGHGHDVLGLARSDAAVAALVAAGATPHRGSVEDPDSLRRGAADADGAIHTAYFHQFSHAGLATRLRVVLGGSPRRIVPRFLAATIATDRTAIATIGQALGPGCPFVSTFGTLSLPAGRLATEDDDVAPDGRGAVGAPRGATEQVVADLAGRGVRSCGCRPSSMATATMASCRRSSATPANTASRATPATVATGGPRCTASTRPACSYGP